MEDASHKFTVYRTLNTINEKYYIGVHKTSDINDNYIGSGKIIKQAIKKYGRDNFKKEILHIFDTADEAYEAERNLVNEAIVSDTKCYNIQIGGIPTKEWDEDRKTHYRNNVKSRLGSKHSEETKQKIATAAKNRTHSKETKQKISLASKGRESYWKGKSQTPESNKKRSVAHLNLKKVKCPHCKKVISPQNAKRWHFDNCKLLTF